MKVFFPTIAAVLLAVFFGCKTLPTVEPATTDHRWYDAEGNVYLAPPAPGEGIQIEVDTFNVPFNTEVQGDFYFQLPIDIPIKVGRIEIAMNKGSHHMNCYRTTYNFFKGLSHDTIIYDKSQLGDDTASVLSRRMIFTHDGKIDTQYVPWQQSFQVTSVANNSDIMIEAQIDSLDWDLPRLPNDTSVSSDLRGMKTAVVLQPHQSMIVENHYVNATIQSTPGGKGKIYINLYYATDPNPVMASMYFGKFKHLVIPPDTLNFVSPVECNFPPTVTRPFYILGMTGHYHTHGKSFFVDVISQPHDSLGNRLLDSLGHPITIVVKSKIYTNNTWDEPPFTSYSTPVKIDVGQTLRYTAIYDNPTNTSIHFGPHVLYEEHENLFAWFVPALNGGQTVYDNGP